MSVPGHLHPADMKIARARVSNINREQFRPRFTRLGNAGDAAKNGCIHRCENSGGEGAVSPWGMEIAAQRYDTLRRVAKRRNREWRVGDVRIFVKFGRRIRGSSLQSFNPAIVRAYKGCTGNL